MADRGRYDSAMFWLAFGTAAAVIGLALMTIGVTRTGAGQSLFASGWFDAGIALLAAGGLLLLWALVLYLARRRSGAQEKSESGSAGTAVDSKKSDVVSAYYADRKRLYDVWERDQERKGKQEPKSR